MPKYSFLLNSQLSFSTLGLGNTDLTTAANQPAAGHSMLFVWITIGVAALGLIIAVGGAAVCIGILLHYKYERRKMKAAATSSWCKPPTKV